MGAAVAPNIIYSSFTAAEGGGKWAPKVPLPRRAREIPTKAGILRVVYDTACTIIIVAEVSSARVSESIGK